MSSLPERPVELAELLSISIPYASQLLNGKRPWPRALAITAFRHTGVKIGPIEQATEAEIDILEKFETARSEPLARAS